MAQGEMLLTLTWGDMSKAMVLVNVWTAPEVQGTFNK